MPGMPWLPGHGKRLPNLARWARCAAGGVPNALFSVTYSMISMVALQIALSHIVTNYKRGKHGKQRWQRLPLSMSFSIFFHCDVSQKAWVCPQALSSVIVYLGYLGYMIWYDMLSQANFWLSFAMVRRSICWAAAVGELRGPQRLKASTHVSWTWQAASNQTGIIAWYWPKNS